MTPFTDLQLCCLRENPLNGRIFHSSFALQLSLSSVRSDRQQQHQQVTHLSNALFNFHRLHLLFRLRSHSILFLDRSRRCLSHHHPLTSFVLNTPISSKIIKHRELYYFNPITIIYPSASLLVTCSYKSKQDHFYRS